MAEEEISYGDVVEVWVEGGKRLNGTVVGIDKDAADVLIFEPSIFVDEDGNPHESLKTRREHVPRDRLPSTKEHIETGTWVP